MILFDGTVSIAFLRNHVQIDFEKSNAYLESNWKWEKTNTVEYWAEWRKDKKMGATGTARHKLRNTEMVFAIC